MAHKEKGCQPDWKKQNQRLVEHLKQIGATTYVMTEIRTQAPPSLKDDRVERLPLLRLEQGEPVTSVDAWEQRRLELEKAWRDYLGSAPYELSDLKVDVVREDDLGDCTGTLLYIETEPGYSEQCYLLVPKPRPVGKRPAVVVFFYDIDTPAGHYMGSRIWKEGNETRRFARHLVRRGYVTLVQRWFHEGYAAALNTGGGSLQARFGAGSAHFAQKFPGWKGLGRVVSDASRCVDYLQTLDIVDANRIGCMGHSLGGKMALYAGAFDQRFRVIVSSEPGIGLSYSNWDAPWYLGPEVREPDFPLDHHQLLGLIAPRPFLLIGGEDADGDRSWRYLNSAQEVYGLYGDPGRIGMANHREGHSPTEGACAAAYHWFDQWL